MTAYKTIQNYDTESHAELGLEIYTVLDGPLKGRQIMAWRNGLHWNYVWEIDFMGD